MSLFVVGHPPLGEEDLGINKIKKIGIHGESKQRPPSLRETVTIELRRVAMITVAMLDLISKQS